MNKIINADAVNGLKQLPSDSVFCCVTSPPYYGLRDYGVKGQIGLEQSPQEYIERLVDVFREVKRVLRNDGTLWVNIADSYAGSGRGISSTPISERNQSKQIYFALSDSDIANMPNVWNGIKPKDMIGIPWMLAFALRADGWYLRSDIIWQKPNCMPENIKDRPTKSYEHIFLLSKSNKYYYDNEAIKEPLKPISVERYKCGRSGKDKYSKTPQAINGKRVDFSSFDKEKRNKRDVWTVSTNTYRNDEHFAMFPEKLIEPCILAGSPKGGVVLDPFFGSGTTGVVAKRHGREYIGIEINQKYCEMAQERIDAVEVN